MKDLIKAMVQQIAVVGNGQQGALITVDQILQTLQIIKIQEGIGLVHDQQLRLSQHLTDDLQQLIFTAADHGNGQISQIGQTGSL